MISFASSVGGVVMSISALSAPEQGKIERLAAESRLFVGFAVAALLADAGVRNKFRPIVDVDQEIRYRRQLAQRGLEDVKAEIENQRKLA